MRVYNFSAGPSVLPLPVLERAKTEMCDTNGTGQSVMEMSHRSKDFKPIIEKTGNSLRELMKIPDNYKVLFLQGGASLQFAMIPLNLAAGEFDSPKKKTSFAETGVWAQKAAEEAAKWTDVSICASSKDRSFVYIPPAEKIKMEGQEAYLHITLNNTIVGTKWPYIPDTGSIPLVSDISSCILSGELDVSKFALLYAGAQKNLGPAGTTIVIIREDFIGRAPSWVPAMLRYDIHAGEGSMYNTPPCWGIYIIGLVLDWVKENGGVDAISKINHEKANLFYSFLEESKSFSSPIEKSSRSLMNIPFVCNENNAEKRKELEAKFVKDAADAGLVNLAGHRLVGGMRASIYNAMPVEGIKALIEFMKKFETENKR